MKRAAAKIPATEATEAPTWAAPPTTMVGVAEAMVTLLLWVAATVAWGWPSVNSDTATGFTLVAGAVAWG